jgi:hypothetical protein
LLIVLVVVVVVVLGHGSMLVKAFLRGEEGERRKHQSLVSCPQNARYFEGRTLASEFKLA